MSYQKAPFFWRLVLLFLLSAPVSIAFGQIATAAPAPSDRPPTSLPAPVAPVTVTPVTVTPVTKEGTVRIDGSSSMSTLNRLLQQRYQERYPDLEVEIAQHGTEAALKALLAEEIDLAAIGRSLTLAEKAEGLVEIPVSQEKVAIIVGRENPFQGSLSLDQLAKIFRGEITNWSEVGGPDARIRLIDRPATSDTRLALSQYGLLAELGRSPLKRPNLVRLETDDTAEVIQTLGDDGISYAILEQIRHQDAVRLVRIAVLQDILPDSALYPYVFSRGYAYKATIAPALQSFIGFATTQPGQDAVIAARGNEARAILSTIATTTAAAAMKPVPAIVPSEARVEKPAPVISKSPLSPTVATANAAKDAAKPQTATSARIARAKVPAPAKANVPAAKVITSVPSGRVIAQPELKQQYFDKSPDVKTPIGVEKPARVVEKAAATETVNLPVAAEKLQKPVQPPVPKAVRQDKESDRALPAWFGWLLLPLILIGLFFRWLNHRRATISAPQKARQTPSPVATVAPPAEINPPNDVASVVSQPATSGTAAIEPVAEIGEGIEPEAEAIDTAARVEAAEILAAEEIPTESVEMAEPIAPAPLAEPAAEPAAEPLMPQPIAAVAAGLMTPVPPDDSEPTVETFKETFVGYLQGYLSKTPETATLQESYTALAYLVRDRMLKRKRPEAYLQGTGVKVVGEIAAEYVPGPHLVNNLINLGYLEQVRQALRHLGLNLEDLAEQEEEPGLGNGDLGRLMVCYLDALSTAEIPAIGYGIRYEYGIFDQEIRDGRQVEIPDSWLQNGNPWELELPEAAVEVKFGGQTQIWIDDRSNYRVHWIPAEVITGIPYDTPILGYHAHTINPMRLWKAENSDQLCKVLYPVDAGIQGKALRLKQQFFLVSCALQDALRLHILHGGSPDTLPDRFALQINDTDPTLAVAELMRLLVDEHGITWESAWDVTQRTLSYTNHSLMPETLDDLWTVGVFAHFLPRHLEIIFEINTRFLETVRSKYPDDLDRLQRLSLIDEQGDRYVRTTSLACVGSHAVNGVSELHTQLLQQTILRDFYELYPEKFSNKTNGITPRRFLLLTNPRLANLITSEIGDGWITDLGQLQQLEGFVNDPQFCSEWQQIKQANKQDLAVYIQQQTGIQVDVNSLFDLHTMRLHEYMRQHLQVLHILTLYNRIKANPEVDITPRTFIFGGKAAPDYFTAKLIIKLIHSVADWVNPDSDVRGRLKVVFLPDFNLKMAQRIYPAADVAEYISTAGTEACSTGNVIFAANGATIIGTLDGSNIELREAVGVENFYLFGLTAQEGVDLRSSGYRPLDDYNANPDLKAALDLISSGALSHGDTELFRPLVNLLLDNDYYLLLADYQSFLECQERVSQAYRNPEQWTQRSILNTARMGRFSADRAIAEYSQEIWNIKPVSDRLRQFTQPQAG